MNQHDPDSEQALRAIDRFYATQVNICIAALNRMQSAELADKNIIIRAIMCDMPDCGIFADPAAEDYGVDFWADRAEYVNDTSFNLYVTQAEEKVLWNIGDKQAPVYPADLFDGAEFQTDGDGAGGRAAGSGFVRLLRRAGDGVLGGERIAGVLDRMTEMQDGEEEAGRPVS